MNLRVRPRVNYSQYSRTPVKISTFSQSPDNSLYQNSNLQNTFLRRLDFNSRVKDLIYAKRNSGFQVINTD